MTVLENVDTIGESDTVTNQGTNLIMLESGINLEEMNEAVGRDNLPDQIVHELDIRAKHATSEHTNRKHGKVCTEASREIKEYFNHCIQSIETSFHDLSFLIHRY